MSAAQIKKAIQATLLILLVILFYTAGPGCPFQWLLGIPCMGCGMTRAFLCLVRGDIKGAFFYHPAFPLVPLALLLFIFRKHMRKRLLFFGIILILLLFVIIYAWRMASAHPVMAIHLKEGLIYRIVSFILNLKGG